MCRILFAAKHSWTALRMSRPLFVGSYLQVTWWALGQCKKEKFSSNDNMTEFADWRGGEALSLAVARVTDLLCGNNFWINLTFLRLFCYCHFVIRQDHSFCSPRERWTSSVAALALFLVAFTTASLVLCRGKNSLPFCACLAELWPCTYTRVADRKF